MEDCAIEDRVVRYWTIRSRDFGAVRKNELGSIMGRRWQEELEARLPAKTPLNILDVGTGTGFFAILMAQPKDASIVSAIPCAGLVPTPEELIAYCVSKL